MNDVIRSEVFTTVSNLINNAPPFNRIVTLDVLLERASITIFCDEIAVIIGMENIYEFDDVIVMKLLHDGDFVIEEVNVSHVHIFYFNDLYRKRLPLRALFGSSINSAAESTTDEISIVKGVFSDAFLSSIFFTNRVLSVALLHIDGTIGVNKL
jgi:hypothetical protein